MTTAYITGGSVEFTRPSNYSADKSGAKVALTFACAEGTPDDAAKAMLDTVAAMAKAKAHEMVGDTPPTPLNEGVVTLNGKAVPVVYTNGPASVPDPMVAASAALSTAAPNAITSPVASTAPAPVGNIVVEPIPNGAVYTAAPAEPAAPDPIPDSDLVAAITQANARLLNRATNDVDRQQVPGRLRDVVAKYVAPPGRVQSIPQEKRASAIADLNAL